MSKNANIVVDFDGIVANLIPASGTNNYTGCDAYVTYDGSMVSDTTFTLTKNKNYTFTLAAQEGNACVATEFPVFQDSDLELSKKSDLVLNCKADKEDTAGKNVTFGAYFDNASHNACTASWDPKIIVRQ